MRNRVKQARKEAGMTQEELAKAVGVTQAAVAQWESGNTDPSLPVFVKLSSVLGQTINDLITEDDDPADSA